MCCLVKNHVTNNMICIKLEFLIVNAPELSGVYRFIDVDQNILYIGKAKNLKNRLRGYLNPQLPRIRLMVSKSVDLQIIVTNTESEALLLEAKFIKTTKPKFNILLKDDSLMSFLKINTTHLYPSVEVVRRRSIKEKTDKNLYIGPFVSNRYLQNTMNELIDIFKIRTCNDYFFEKRKKPCFQYQINKCSAPCVGNISQPEYQQSVDYLINLVTGKTKQLLRHLRSEMKKMSKDMFYEKAAKLRDIISNVEYMATKHKKEFVLDNADVISITEKCEVVCMQIFLYRFGQFTGNKTFIFYKSDLDFEDEIEMYEIILWQYYSNSEVPKKIIIDRDYKLNNLKQAIQATFNLNICIVSNPKKDNNYKAIMFVKHNCEVTINEHIKQSQISLNKLIKLQKLFHLPKVPLRIEVYDNSHIMGKHPVGAMIVILNGKFHRPAYRKHHLKMDKFGGDDYALLRMMLESRCLKIIKLSTEDEQCPSLILVDGGKGHLSVAIEVLKRFNLSIPIIAIAKSEFRNKGNERFFMSGQAEPIELDNSDEIMQYLQIMRDEAHNFAIKAHIELRDKSNFMPLL